MSRNKILATIRRNTQTTAKTPLPKPTHAGRGLPSPTPHDGDMDVFIEAVQSVGGECIDIRGLTSDDMSRSDLSSAGLTPLTAMSGTGDPDLREYFDGSEPTVLRAHFGVIENGACWIDHRPEDDRTRYTLPEHLAILLPHDALVPTMHEAYTRIKELGIDDFGLFLSGPSKTADIEQALVIGAQGAISTKVFLT